MERTKCDDTSREDNDSELDDILDAEILGPIPHYPRKDNGRT